MIPSKALKVPNMFLSCIVLLCKVGRSVIQPIICGTHYAREEKQPKQRYIWDTDVKVKTPEWIVIFQINDMHEKLAHVSTGPMIFLCRDMSSMHNIANVPGGFMDVKKTWCIHVLGGKCTRLQPPDACISKCVCRLVGKRNGEFCFWKRIAQTRTYQNERLFWNIIPSVCVRFTMSVSKRNSNISLNDAFLANQGARLQSSFKTKLYTQVLPGHATRISKGTVGSESDFNCILVRCANARARLKTEKHIKTDGATLSDTAPWHGHVFIYCMGHI